MMARVSFPFLQTFFGRRENDERGGAILGPIVLWGLPRMRARANIARLRDNELDASRVVRDTTVERLFI